MNTTDTTPTVGWHIEHHDAGHFKFYTALVFGSQVVFHWGRIGTAGSPPQIKTFPTPAQARAAAEKKLQEKIHKGYEWIQQDFEFTLDTRDIEWAIEKNEPRRLTLLFDRAQRDPKFARGKESVLDEYDAFLAQAQHLMDRAASSNFDSVMNDFEELEQSWAEIEDRHSLASTTIEMTKTALKRALLAGKF